MKSWMVFGTMLILAAQGATSHAAAPLASPDPSTQVPSIEAAAPARSLSEIQSDEPPASTYDLAPAKDRAAPMPAAGMLAHLWRTVLALAAVVALIMLFGRLLLPRLAGRLHRGQGQRVKVLERIAVDNKNALLVVALADSTQVVLSSGEGGLRMICPMPEAHSKSSFNDSFREVPTPKGADVPLRVTAPGQKERDARAS